MLVGLWGPFNKQDGCSVNSWIIFLLFFPFLNLLGPLSWWQFNFLQPEILPPHAPPPSLLSDMSSLKMVKLRLFFFITNLTRVKYWHFRMSTNVKADFKQEHMLQTEVTPRFVITAVVFIAVSIFVLSSLPLSSWHDMIIMTLFPGDNLYGQRAPWSASRGDFPHPGRFFLQLHNARSAHSHTCRRC